MENIDVYVNKAVELVMEYGPQLLLAIITLFVGLWLIKLVVKSVEHQSWKQH